jgi:transposase
MGPQRRKKLTAERRAECGTLCRASLRVGRAWAIKEAARQLWSYTSRTWAIKGCKAWMGWAQRSRLDPINKTAPMIASHLDGIVNAIVAGVTNAAAESLNSKIQRLKRDACGFRNRAGFRTAILFHCGALELYPALEAHPIS